MSGVLRNFIDRIMGGLLAMLGVRLVLADS